MQNYTPYCGPSGNHPTMQPRGLLHLIRLRTIGRLFWTLQPNSVKLPCRGFPDAKIPGRMLG